MQFVHNAKDMWVAYKVIHERQATTNAHAFCLSVPRNADFSWTVWNAP